MHSHTIERWSHDHAFLGEMHERNERRTLSVVALTAATMLVEIVGGHFFNSMALVADGWHMSTHVLALGIATSAYRYARRHSRDPQFAFGTGKLGELAGFASATILGLIALLIGYESVSRLLTPLPIAFGEAIPIAALGLTVNLASVALLHGSGDASHGHGHHDHGHHDHAHHHTAADVHRHHDGSGHDARGHDGHGGHGYGGHDTNMRAAYLHVVADALTSVLAIAALLSGYFLGWTWLDSLIGLIGAAVIVSWAVSLLRSSGAVLLDLVPSRELARAIREAVELEGDRVADLHLWRLGPGHTGVILSVVTDHPLSPDDYKRRLVAIDGLSHVTVEVNRCADDAGHHAIAA